MTACAPGNATLTDELTFIDDQRLLDSVLRPYEGMRTKYLKSATVTASNGRASAQGRFSIPNSCYMDVTGRLNAVEMNICFNQLMYYLIAKCVQERALPAFSAWSMEDYWAKQLPDMLIVKFSNNIKRSIDPLSFSGTVSFAEFTEGPADRPMQIVDMPWRFWDAAGGRADGEVRMALLDPPGGKNR